MKIIWSSNGELEELLDKSPEEKREFLKDWFDPNMIDGLNDDQLDEVISDDPEIYNQAARDFEFEISPEIAAQVKDGLIFDEKFNLVDPSKLLDIDAYSADLEKHDDGTLYFNAEGRKAFPILGFSHDQEDFIRQLDQLGILDTLHNLYPEKDDEEFDDPYYYTDLIPFDWEILEKVLTKPALNFDGVNEEMTDTDTEVIDEASTKNAKKLKKELKELKALSNEYGREYFTQMPFTSYDNDPMSIEMQYPEFFRIVKSFFKEMGVLEGNQLNDTDILDMSWDEDISQHDWDTLMAVCDRLVNKGGTVQIEKIYKNNFDDHLGSDDEIIASREVEEESLDEAAEEKTINIDWADTSLPWYNEEPTEEEIINSIHNAIPISKNLKIKVVNVVGPGGGWPEVNLTGDKKDLIDFLTEYGADPEDIDMYFVESLKEDDESDYHYDENGLVDSYLLVDANGDTVEAVGDLDTAIQTAKEFHPEVVKIVHAKSDDSFRFYDDFEETVWERDNESLTEGAAEEMAMHALKEEVAQYIYDNYLEFVDDNLALSVAHDIKNYNLDWCDEEVGYPAQIVTAKKKALARAIADLLFKNAPRELGLSESLTEGFKGLAREINKEFRKDMKEWDNAKVYADEDGLDLAEVSADSDLIKKIEKFVKAKGYKAKYTSDDGFLAINESLTEEIWHNRGAGDCEIIERSASGKNALVKRLADGALQPYVIALNMGEDSWGQGKYYTELEDAKKDWKRYKFD